MESNEKSLTEVIYADGSCEGVDPTDLFERADLLLHIYGIGNCKSFTEFINMVDEEDPFIINGLLSAAERRVIEQNGGTSRSNNTSTSKRSSRNQTVGDPDSPSKLASFLKEMGANREEVDEALAKIKSGQIKAPVNDYSYITPEVLSSPDFDFEGVLKQMGEDARNSINFKVSDNTLKRKEKKLTEKK